MYTELDTEDTSVLIHLLPATEFIKKEGVGNFKKEIENGLTKLTEVLKSHPNVKTICAISWIVAKNPKLLTSLGFTVEGSITEEERRENFLEETRPVAKASMTREDLFARYSN